MKKIIIILIFIILILSFFITKIKKEEVSNKVTVDSIIINEKNKIDSLNNTIDSLLFINNSIKDSIKIIEIEKEIILDNLKELPIDSSIVILRENLKNYENKY